jgi:hypothetical protein
MKSMLKCEHSFFIVYKIYRRLQTQEEISILAQLIADNMIYIKDKFIKAKCVKIIED